MKNGKVRLRLNVDVRKEIEDFRLNTIECYKSTRAANVDLPESLLDNWLKNNHITVDKIYYLRSLFVFFYEFHFSNLFLNRRKPAQKQNPVATR